MSDENEAFVTVARLEEIPADKGASFQFQGRNVAIFRVGGELKAIDDMCPHMGAELSAGHYEDGVVVCPWHAWSFDVRDGSWCDNPRVKIDTFRVRVLDGMVQLAQAVKSDSVDSPCKTCTDKKTSDSEVEKDE